MPPAAHGRSAAQTAPAVRAAVGSVLAGGAGTLLVVALWQRLFPALARRDALVAPSRG